MSVGFGKWLVTEGAKKFLKSKKGGVEAISAIKPGTKLKGQKTVQEVKNEASMKQFKDAMQESTAKMKSKLKLSAEKLQKLNETLKKQKKILDD